MELESSLLHNQIPGPFRNLQPQVGQPLQQQQQHNQPHLSHPSLASHSLDLTGLDDSDVGFPQDLHRMQGVPQPQIYHNSNAFAPNHGHRHLHQQSLGSPHTPQQLSSNPYPILAPATAENPSIARLTDDDIFGGAQRSNGHISTKIVVDPPNLEEWRERLFNVDELITLSEEEY